MRYAAFLRGINVGGHKPIKMTELKKAFENAGFTEVRTILASGNVVFTSEQSNQNSLRHFIESELQKALGKDFAVILRSMDELKRLYLFNPFKDIEITPSIRLYVTFLAEKTAPRSIALPYTSLQNEFTILYSTTREVFSVLDLSIGKGTPEIMNLLEKEFGQDITTRNWNTILKVLK